MYRAHVSIKRRLLGGGYVSFETAEKSVRDLVGRIAINESSIENGFVAVKKIEQFAGSKPSRIMAAAFHFTPETNQSSTTRSLSIVRSEQTVISVAVVAIMAAITNNQKPYDWTIGD